MISQECEPALGWIAPPSNTLKIPSHGSFRDVEAELPQLAVDLRSTPVQILFRHAANQSANLSGSLRPTARACARTPSPVEPKSNSVPAHHDVQRNNDEASAHPDQMRRRMVQNNRSTELNFGRGCFRLNTASC